MSEDLVAFRDTDGNVGLMDAHCPHRLADLFFGRNEECGLRCVYHGWKFDINGECVDMPNEPAESNFKSKIRTAAYPCRDKGGVIWAFMGPKEKMPDLPQLPWLDLPSEHVFIGKLFVECNFLQAMEGEIDNSHVSYLHSTLDPKSAVSSSAVGGGPTMFGYQMVDKTPRGVVKDAEYGIHMGWRRNAGPDHYHWRSNQWLMPFHTQIASPAGGTLLSLMRPPRDDETSWAFILQWNPERPLNAKERTAYEAGLGFYPEVITGTFRAKRNPDNDFLIDRSLQRSFSFTGITGSIYNQDLSVTTSMGPIVDRTKEHLGTADIIIIAVRRKLRKLAMDLEKGIEPYAAQHSEVFNVRAIEGLLPREVPFEEGPKTWLAQARS
jgi:phenylpropionate dioxygenase-like ring-hydroxylating dioxygenase large terminal subunit